MSEGLLPHNASDAEAALDLSTARVGSVPVPVADVWSPAACPAPVLPWLAWAFSVGEWDANWTESQKRGVVAAAAEVHRKKGTRGAVNAALSGVGFASSIVEWWEQEPAGDPYTFAVEVFVDQEPVATAGIAQSIVGVIEGAKNVRSHFDGVQISGVTRCRESFGAAVFFGERVLIEAETVA